MVGRVRLAVVALLLFAQHAAAWNSQGHLTINLLAWENLNTRDRAAVVDLLRDHPRFEQHFLGRMPPQVWTGSDAEQAQWVFAFAGTWPDVIRRAGDGVSRDDVTRFGRSEWHYINLPIYLTPADRDALKSSLSANRSKTPPADRDAYRQNILQAILNARATLGEANASRADRAVALCWFLHLAGDSHQPCHAASLFSRARFPQGDRGGNEVPLRGAKSLHSYWDAAILPSGEYNAVRAKAAKLAPRLSTPEIIAAAKEQGPINWLLESYRFAGADAYDAHVRAMLAAAEGYMGISPMNPPRDYDRRAGELATLRACQAGARIATGLQGLVETATRPPTGIASKPKPEPVKPARVARLTPVASLAAERSAPASEPAADKLTHWLNTKSYVRHNAGCRWYGNTKNGRPCTATDGSACGQCGG